MARSINRLSDRTVKAITEPGRHADGGNLFLIVDKPRGTGAASLTTKPAKRWAFIFRWDGKLKEMGLGSVNAVSLADARELAGQYRGLLAKNRNPIELRRAEQKLQAAGRTFGEVAKQLHETRKEGWKSEKVKRQWLMSIQAYCKPIWDKPVDTVSTDDVLAILMPVWSTKAEIASKTRGRIEAVLDAARARGLIPTDRANPARWRGHLGHLLPKRQKLQRGHHPSLPYTDAPAFMARLRDREAMAALCLELTILCASRSSETMGMRWHEVDLDNKLWIVPSTRMKGTLDQPRQHRVPLSDRAVEILRKVQPLRSSPDDFVFPGQKAGRPLSTMALEMLVRRMKLIVTAKVRGEDKQVVATPHGFRSTFRDWAGDCTSFPREIIEAALAHAVGDEVERAYRRGDALEKRRQLMQAWADYCVGKSNVVTLTAAV